MLPARVLGLAARTAAPRAAHVVAPRTVVVTPARLTALLLHASPLSTAAASRLALRVGTSSQLRVVAAVRAPGSDAVRAFCSAAPEKGPDGGEGGPLPMKTKQTPRQAVWTVGKFAMIFAAAGLAIAGGYNIIRILMPTKMSPNNVFNRASDIVQDDPEVVSRMGGDVKCYGMDFNQRREGRRFHIPEYRYTKDNVDYLRIKFTVEGPGGSKGDVYAEVRSDLKDQFHYLIVQLRNARREVITIQDNRAPEKPLHVRKAETAMALQSVRATLYGKDSEEDTMRQKVVLGEHMNLIRYIQCDENPFECQSAGVTSTPTWMVDNKLYEGFQELEDLEKIAESVKGKTMVVA